MTNPAKTRLTGIMTCAPGEMAKLFASQSASEAHTKTSASFAAAGHINHPFAMTEE